MRLGGCHCWGMLGTASLSDKARAGTVVFGRSSSSEKIGKDKKTRYWLVLDKVGGGVDTQVIEMTVVIIVIGRSWAECGYHFHRHVGLRGRRCRRIRLKLG